MKSPKPRSSPSPSHPLHSRSIRRPACWPWRAIRKCTCGTWRGRRSTSRRTIPASRCTGSRWGRIDPGWPWGASAARSSSSLSPCPRPRRPQRMMRPERNPTMNRPPAMKAAVNRKNRPSRSPATRSTRCTVRTASTPPIPATRSSRTRGSVGRGSSRSRGASTRRCTASGCGRCGSSRASARRRHEQAVQVPARERQGHEGQHRPLHRVRPAHAHGPGQRRRALRRRGGALRRGDRHDRGHAPAVRRHPARGRHRQPDDQRPGRGHLGDVPRDGKQRGFDWNKLGGTLQNDILKEFHAQNEFIYPPEASVKLVVDTIEFQSSTCRGGTACRSPATTSARPARRGRRSSPSRCATAWSTSSGA
jgi:hypothetical protein